MSGQDVADSNNVSNQTHFGGRQATGCVSLGKKSVQGQKKAKKAHVKKHIVIVKPKKKAKAKKDTAKQLQAKKAFKNIQDKILPPSPKKTAKQNKQSYIDQFEAMYGSIDD